MTSNAPFEKRALSVEIIVPSGIKKMNWQTGKPETSAIAGQVISLQNYRILADIECYGLTYGAEASIQIYNVPDALLRALSGYGSNGLFDYRSIDQADIAQGKGTVTVEIYLGGQTSSTSAQSGASDAERAAVYRQMIFKGNLLNCTAEMQSVPDPFLQIQAHTSMDARLTAPDVLSYKGAVDATLIARQIADSMGWSFEDGGVTTILQNPYLHGSTAEQLRELALQGLFNYTVELGVLAIWPYGSSRNKPATQAKYGKGTVTISPTTGLLGYPAFNGTGVSFRNIYRPDLRSGDQVILQTDAPNAAGTYNVYSMAHHLSSEMPGGPWETEVMASFIPAGLGLSAQFGGQ